MITIIIKADTNDADYITSEIKNPSKEVLKLVKKFAKLIKSFKPYKGKSKTSFLEFNHDNNWPDGEYAYRPDLGGKSVEDLYGSEATLEEIDYFRELCPYGEYGIHTIESIRIIEIKSDKELL